MRFNCAALIATSALTTFFTTGAAAQTAPAGAPAALQQSEAPAEGQGSEETIVVTGSRIDRAGFDQPTPTTVIGETELRQGARPNLQQVLNDQPQFRQSTTPQNTSGNTATGVAPVDLRGLGAVRTLTLIQGRRFVGQNNLNFIPFNLVERVEVVTGGASAAWGSGAVAGVVNIILNDRLEGLALGADTGISTRGDGMRYGVDGSFGTRFADGRAHFMIGAEYVRDEGIFRRSSRPNLDATIVRVDPFNPNNLATRLTPDVNFGNQTLDGLILSGVLAGQVFNRDGTLRAFDRGIPLGPGAFPEQMIGGRDGVSRIDFQHISTPFDRLSAYARLSYDLGGATIWADASYARATSINAPFQPDARVPSLTIRATNPFLSPEIRSRLQAAGQTSFTFGRFFSDVLTVGFDAVRENKEGAIGIRGEFGQGFKYNAHYSHGVIESDERLTNSRIVSKFNNAIDAVSSGGQIVCAINADASTANDDPACVPFNPFGAYNASAAAIDYVTGTGQSVATTKLDSLGAELQGDLFSLWAGPITAAAGVEARWESIRSFRNADAVALIFGGPSFTNDLNGKFNVKEVFGELLVPVVDVPGTINVDLNGAARYSDYSTSGGIWSWKAGATVRLLDDILLRATRSRDIRSPALNELYFVRSVTRGSLVDLDDANRRSIPGYNPTPSTVVTNRGGNPKLEPEIAKTFTAGVAWTPSFFQGFRASVDYYDINVAGAITTLTGSNLTLACARGSADACASVVRNPVTQTVEEVNSDFRNIASFSVRGIDIEASYTLPLSRLSAGMEGSLRLRALATYVDRFVFDTLITRIDTAGDVGNQTANGVPRWRGTLVGTYQNENIALDARLRYVDGGKYDSQLTTLVNNEVEARTYVDVGAQFRLDDRFTFSLNVNNLFNVKAPLTTTGQTHYDIVGTYFSAGARVRF